MDEKKFIYDYLKDFSKLILPEDDLVNKMIQVKVLLLKTRKLNSKTMIFGNGGSATISSHVSVDLTKNAKIRTINFNESDLITCFSNDFGYEKWVEKTIEYYFQDNDLLILISSSGESPNMINAAQFAKEKKIKVITFTGHKKENKLSTIGDINFWIDSKAYNFIENTHQVWLLTICDLIIGKREYQAK